MSRTDPAESKKSRASEDDGTKKRNLIYAGVIVACIAGAVGAYYFGSLPSEPKADARTQEAEKRAEVLQQELQKAIPAAAQPVEIPRTSPRGMIPAK